MKTTDKNKTQFPQVVEIPEPLEINPSVDPELANGLLATIDHLSCHWEELDISMSRFVGKVGCLACHAERFSSWKRPDNITEWRIGGTADSYPVGDPRRFYAPHYNEGFGGIWWSTPAKLEARITHFLNTGR